MATTPLLIASGWILLPLVAAAGVTISSQRGAPRGYRVRTTAVPRPAGSGSVLSPEEAGRPGWREADAISWGTAPYSTDFRALRAESGLWLRFDADDDAPWHTLIRRDDPLWDEEVVEIFIDPDGDGRNYAEIEINPANVVCDLLMHRGDPDKSGDLAWDFAGVRSRVDMRRDAAGKLVGWTAVAFLPWEGFAALPATDVELPPAPGDRWRFNVFRIKRPHGPADPTRDVILAAWSPVPAGSFHVPEVFGRLEFSP